jgi:hypothetical protein
MSFMPPISPSRKDRALQLLDQIRTELETESLQNAVLQADLLAQHLQDWQKMQHIQAARAWLDEALQSELLAFNADAARQHLAKWEQSVEANHPELAQYRQRVEKHIAQKAATLQIRGVIAHCEELFTKAKELELGKEPPHPDFVLSQYYAKAVDIVLAAQAEHKNHAELDGLQQKTQRLYDNKEAATAVYEMALEQKKYTSALHNLSNLPADFLVPRFTSTEDSLGNIRLIFQGMIPLTEARTEIETLARAYAAASTQQAIMTAITYLDAHTPQQAVETLELSENITRFLDVDLKTQLAQLQQQAKTDLHNQTTAEQQLEEANRLITENPLKAWDVYAQAYQTYQWVNGMRTTRQNILKALQTQLSEQIQSAEELFQQRQIQQVRQMAQQAAANYGNKDAALDTLLEKFAELNDMTNRYEEYVSTATNILNQVKELLWQDAAGANELLSQVESYPEIVLESFPDLYDIRLKVNQRLNADQIYGQVYGLMFSQNLDDIRQGISQANDAMTEFVDDGRFQNLAKGLQLHAAFLAAQQQYTAGQPDKALQLLAPIVAAAGHPDYAAAIELANIIRNANTDATS